MARPMIDENARALEKKLDEGYGDVREAVMKLRDALAKYGFRGTVVCNLEVQVCDDDGFENAVATRSIKHKFAR